MPFVYVTGAPGTGKTTVQKRLLALGYAAYDLDSPAFGGPYAIATNEPVTIPPPHERTAAWFRAHEWRINRDEFVRLRELSRDRLIIICGVAEQDVSIVDLFDTVLYLSIPDDLLITRLNSRTDNDYGKNDFERADILSRKRRLDEKYETNGATHVDASKDLDETVRIILNSLKING